MAITRDGSNAGQFTIEIVFVPEQNESMFTDTYPYTRDKLWFETWLDNLDYTNLGMVMLGGDLLPCLSSGCESSSVTVNHANWIKSIWSWKEQNYQSLNALYEVVGVQSSINNEPTLIEKLTTWIENNTPNIPAVAASLYLELPSGADWNAYANATTRILDAYHSNTDKPLWIDEYGKSLGTGWTEEDQKAAYDGFLAASVCWRQNQYRKFAWVAGNDYPYNGDNWFGLASSFVNNYPTMRPAWNTIKLYYNLQECP